MRLFDTFLVSREVVAISRSPQVMFPNGQTAPTAPSETRRCSVSPQRSGLSWRHHADGIGHRVRGLGPHRSCRVRCGLHSEGDCVASVDFLRFFSIRHEAGEFGRAAVQQTPVQLPEPAVGAPLHVLGPRWECLEQVAGAPEPHPVAMSRRTARRV